MSYSNGANGSEASGTVVLVNHTVLGGHDGQRTVLVVLTNDTQTVTNIYERFTTTDGGFTLRATHTAEGKTLRLYDKICGPSEAHQYEIHYTPAPTGGIDTVVVWLSDFDVTGDAIAAYAFADSPSGTSMTLPSVAATDGDDLFTLVWSDPNVATGRLRPQAPLRTTGNSSITSNFYIEESHEVWQSSTPTGTRSYAVASGSHEGAIGTIMLVGGFPPAGGGWGVGMVRMGAN